jgi:hemerythrin superfamily protein
MGRLCRGYRRRMDAISMLKEDHKIVERLFKRFEKAGERAYAEKRKVADRIIEELAQHAAVEEQLFYPVARATDSDVEDVVLESLEEHHIVKWVLSELDAMDPTDERFTAKMTVLIENVRHHVKDEEQEFFPKVRDALDRNSLAELGQAMETAKKTAPTHPHPRSPDTPPGNVAWGLTSGLVDRIRDTVSGVAQGGVTAVQDLIALVLGKDERAAAPTGPKMARDTATAVRARAASTTAGVRDTGQAVVDGTIDTARAGASGAKRTGRAARASAKRTASTAKRATRTSHRTARAGAKTTRGTSRPAAKGTTRSATAS